MFAKCAGSGIVARNGGLPSEVRGQITSPWECPHCGESLGEPVTVNSREFLGDEIHGGVVEHEDQMCSVCHKEARLRDCQYFSDAQISDMMDEFKAELRRQEKVV